MTTISIVPSSPSLEREMTAFFPPIQTARLAQTVRTLPAQPRTKRARPFPMIAVERSHSAVLFAILFAATAITILLSVLATLDFASSFHRSPAPPQPRAVPALEQRPEQGASPDSKESSKRMIRSDREIRL